MHYSYISRGRRKEEELLQLKAVSLSNMRSIGAGGGQHGAAKAQRLI